MLFAGAVPASTSSLAKTASKELNSWQCKDVDRRLKNAEITVSAATQEIDKTRKTIKDLEAAVAKVNKDCSNQSGPQCNPAHRQNLMMSLQGSLQKREQVAQIRARTQTKLVELKTLKQDCSGKKIEMAKDVPDSLRPTLR